jgi:hypothetical protein
MRRSLSKVLSLVMFISLVIPQPATVFAVDKSTKPLDTNITVTNNAIIADTIKVTGLLATDVIKVYSAATSGVTIGSATVAADKTEVLISLPKLPADSGSVYVTRKIAGMDESDRTPASYEIEATTTSPALDSITVMNNATGKSDSITVNRLIATDVVNIYSAATGGTLLGTAKVALGKTEVTIIRPQLGVDKGSVFVSVSSIGKHESSRVEKEYLAEPITEAPKENNITITNNWGIADSIKITGLLTADTIKVYSAATGGVVIGTATVSTGKSEVFVSVSKLPADYGSVYVSRKSIGMNESDRTSADYGVEGISTSPALDSIAITNNATGKPDTITVNGLIATDVVKVYSAGTGGTLLGIMKVPITKTEATVIIPQLGVDKGSIYVSMIRVGKQESSRVEKEFLAEAISTAPKEGSIVITNNSGIADSIKITGLLATDVVKVYSAATGGVAIGTATVLAGKSEVVISVAKLPADSGSVYVTRKSAAMNESTRIPAEYGVEATSAPLALEAITIVNNVMGKADTINVNGLAAMDIIKVYSSATGGTLLGTAKVTTAKTETAVIVPQLGVDKGSIYVSVSRVGKQESSRVKKDYIAEVMSETLREDNITVTNNSGIADSIKITGLLTGDVVKVYSAATGGLPIGTATLLAGKSEVLINISKLPADSGSVYVTRKSTGMNESARIPAIYGVEPISAPPASDSIIVVNNVTGKTDTITVTGLASTDVVKVYSAAIDGTLLGTSTVPATKTEVTVIRPQLGVGEGSVYVSVSRVGKQESMRIEKEYLAEVVSLPPAADNIIVTNNSGIPDTVSVTGIMETDIVKVYTTMTGGVAIGTATVLIGKYEVLVNVGQLPAASGSVYVTITSTSMNESSRILASYVQEVKSEAPIADNITVTNNSGIADLIKVTGLSETDVVKVYSTETGGSLLGKATVAATKTYATVSTTLMTSNQGSVYVTVTSLGQQESLRIKKDFSAEVMSVSPEIGDIIITNNAGISDIITVTGLVETDVVKVYSAALGGSLLGKATVGATNTDATVNLILVGSNEGSVYVTVTSLGQQESLRTKKMYSAEVISDAPEAESIIVANNAGLGDIVNVTGLVETDVVKVYSAALGGTLLGKATVGTATTDVTLRLTLVGSNEGSVYVTVSSVGKQESTRIKKGYSAELVSEAPLEDNITITNNSGIPDSISVTGLVETDVVKIYSTALGGTLLGKATVAIAKTDVLVTVTLVGSNKGSVYVTVSSLEKKESPRTKKEYSAEPISVAPEMGNITVTNNAGIADLINITGLVENDTVKVYSASLGGTLLGKTTVAIAKTDVTLSLTLVGSSEGSVYVTVSSLGMQESVRTKKIYISEATSVAPEVDHITVANNAGIEDTITVTGLTETDIVKIYSATLGGTLLGTATVPVTKGDVTVNVPQLGTSAGSLYVSITSLGKKESGRIAQTYNGELISEALVDSDIIVTNNAEIADTIKVINLSENDVIKVYSTQTSVTPLAIATVTSNNAFATISVPQLGTNEGNIYITITKLGKLESIRITKAYIAEGIATAISS